MRHSLSAFCVLAAALLCIAAFARFCPPQNPEKGLRRIELGQRSEDEDALRWEDVGAFQAAFPG